jgi:hypothetical protein
LSSWKYFLVELKALKSINFKISYKNMLNFQDLPDELVLNQGLCPFFVISLSSNIKVKYRGPILRVTSQALGSNDLSLDQSGTSIQILPEPNAVT